MTKNISGFENPCPDAVPEHSHEDFKPPGVLQDTSTLLSNKVAFAAKAANIGLWEFIIEENTLIGNDILLSHFGITGQGFIGHYDSFWRYVHPDDKDRVETEVNKALHHKADLSAECRIIWQDGSLHHIQVHAEFHQDKTVQTSSFIGSSQDITSQRFEAAAMRETEAKFRTFYENMPDGLLLTVTDGRILAANPAASVIFQMNEEEICRIGRFGLVDCTDPRLHALIEERTQYGRSKGEVTCIRKDGTTFPGEITSVVFIDACGENRTAMMIRDLFESRNDQQKLVTTSDALQNALNGLNKIMNSSLDIICSIDEEGRFVNISSASERILGYLPVELINTPFIDLVYKDDIEKTINADMKIRTGESVTIFENRYIHKKGNIVPLLWSAKWDENDKLTYCIARDATEKKILEKAIEVERQRFFDLYSQAPSCMGVLKGPNHVYEMANPLYLQLIDKKNIIGKTVKEVLPELESQGVFEFLDKVYTTGETFSANEMLVKFDFRGDGQLVDTYLNYIYQAHRDIENNIDGILFFAIDVTEQVISRKKIEVSEHQYKQIVETAQEGIWLIDENHKTTFVNKKLCEIFEYSEEEMIGKDIYHFMDEEGKELAAKLMILKKDGKSGQKNFKYITKSGNEVWTNVSANPLFNEDNIYKGSLAMVTDITDRIKLEKQLFNEQINHQKAITKSAIHAQEKERGEIGAELHDNVNQLLASANLYLSHSLSLTEGYKPFISKSQEYLLTAVEEIRKLTKALVGPANENELGLIDSLTELVNDILLIRDIQIEFSHDTYQEQESEEGLKLVIYRIIQEQLTNILKHAEATEITIIIKNNHKDLHVVVKDNGKGFDIAASRPGIGLTNIRHRAELYNGSVNIISSPGNGCTVSILFKHKK